MFQVFHFPESPCKTNRNGDGFFKNKAQFRMNVSTKNNMDSHVKLEKNHEVKAH